MFWLKFYKAQYLLNPWMDSFDTCTKVRYWSKVFEGTTPTPLCDLDVKVMDLEYCLFIDWMFWLKFFKDTYLLNP